MRNQSTLNRLSDRLLDQITVNSIFTAKILNGPERRSHTIPLPFLNIPQPQKVRQYECADEKVLDCFSGMTWKQSYAVLMG